MIRKCNKKQHRKLNVKRQTARCKTSNFLENYDIIFALQSTTVTLKEWKMLQKKIYLDQKISTLLVNSKLANKFILFNDGKASVINISLGGNQECDAAAKKNLNINLNQTNTSFSQLNKSLGEKKDIKLFQAPTLLLGCDSQEQVSHVFKLIINKNFFLLPPPYSMGQKRIDHREMVFPWMHSKLRYLPHNRILLGGFYKTIKYSHLDFYQQNNINYKAYPNFRDSLQKKISLLVTSYFSFFQHKVVSAIPNQTVF